VERHVKQLPPPLYVDLERPYFAHPSLLLQSDAHAHVNDEYQQVRNAVSARGHVPGQYGTDHYRDRGLIDLRLNPHDPVLVRYHHAVVHIHLVLHEVVDVNNEMVSKRVG